MNPLDILSTVFGLVPILFLLILALFVLASSVRILPEYERAVIFRLGRLAKAIVNVGGAGNGPGLILLIPIIDRMTKVSLRTVAIEVPSRTSSPRTTCRSR